MSNTREWILAIISILLTPIMIGVLGLMASVLLVNLINQALTGDNHE